MRICAPAAPPAAPPAAAPAGLSAYTEELSDPPPLPLPRFEEATESLIPGVSALSAAPWNRGPGITPPLEENSCMGIEKEFSSGRGVPGGVNPFVLVAKGTGAYSPPPDDEEGWMCRMDDRSAIIVIIIILFQTRSQYRMGGQVK